MIGIQIRDGGGWLRSPEGALPPREFPLVQHDRTVPASQPVKVAKPSAMTEAYLRGHDSGRKSVDRWMPAFFGFIVGAILTALVILAGVTVLS